MQLIQNIVKINIINDNHNGIIIKNSDENTIFNNTIKANNEDGIQLRGS